MAYCASLYNRYETIIQIHTVHITPLLIIHQTNKKLNRKVVLDLNKVKKVKIYPDKLKLYTKHCYTVYTKDKKIIKHISKFLKED